MIQTGGLTVHVNLKKVSVNGTPIHLIGKEYKMLELLVLGKGATVTKEMFLNYLYGGMDEPDAKIVDVFMCKVAEEARDLVRAATSLLRRSGHGARAARQRRRYFPGGSGG